MIMIEAAPSTINMTLGAEQGARKTVAKHYKMRICKHVHMRMITAPRNKTTNTSHARTNKRKQHRQTRLAKVGSHVINVNVREEWRMSCLSTRTVVAM